MRSQSCEFKGLGLGAYPFGVTRSVIPTFNGSKAYSQAHSTYENLRLTISET